MKLYEWILFDADDTLFHFDDFSGLQIMFEPLGVQFNKQDYEAYKVINKSLWTEYQNGEVTLQQLQHRRFDTWASKLQISHQTLSSAFIATMTEICVPLEGALSLLNTLKSKTKLGIITNGFAKSQQARIERTGLRNYFDLLVISEQVGVAKPHQGIFEHALAIMGNPSRKQVLMVGDNPSSDILGGINAGFDTCWLNVDNKPAPEGIKPHYQVSSLSELEKIFIN